MLVIKDRPGFSTQKLMRHYFEGAVKQTEALAKNVHLDCKVAADGSVEYAHEMTQALWVGWALGMRCAERIEREQRAQDVGVGPPQAA